LRKEKRKRAGFLEGLAFIFDVSVCSTSDFQREQLSSSRQDFENKVSNFKITLWSISVLKPLIKFSMLPAVHSLSATKSAVSHSIFPRHRSWWESSFVWRTQDIWKRTKIVGW